MNRTLRPDAGSRSALAALAIIEEVAAAGPGVTALDITHRLRMSRSSAYRLLAVLVDSEYLVRTPDLGGFALGRRIDRLVGIPSTPADRLDWRTVYIRVCCIRHCSPSFHRACWRASRYSDWSC
ncbi:helix-turn-helix domain-containing protein [Mycolicibacterium sp. HS_4_1]